MIWRLRSTRQDVQVAGWDPGRAEVSVWAQTQEEAHIPAQRPCRQENALLIRGGSLSVPTRASIGWMRPTHSGEGSLLYSVSCLKC